MVKISIEGLNAHDTDLVARCIAIALNRSFGNVTSQFSQEGGFPPNKDMSILDTVPVEITVPV